MYSVEPSTAKIGDKTIDHGFDEIRLDLGDGKYRVIGFVARSPGCPINLVAPLGPADVEAVTEIVRARKCDGGSGKVVKPPTLESDQ